MISGVPIFLYAPEDIAITKYASDHGCMFVNSTVNFGELVKALKLLATDETLRSRFAKKSIMIAKNDSDSSSVRKEFLDVFVTGSNYSKEEATSIRFDVRNDKIVKAE